MPFDVDARVALVRVDDVEAAPVPALHVDLARPVLVEARDHEPAAHARQAARRGRAAACMPTGLDHDVARLVVRAAPRRRLASPNASARAASPVLAPAERPMRSARPAPTASCTSSAPRKPTPTTATLCRRRGSRCGAKTFIAQPSGSPGNGAPSSSGGSGTTRVAAATSYSAKARVGEQRDATPTRPRRRHRRIPPQPSCPGAPGASGYANHGRPPTRGRFDAQTPQPSTRTQHLPGRRLGQRDPRELEAAGRAAHGSRPGTRGAATVDLRLSPPTRGRAAAGADSHRCSRRRRSSTATAGCHPTASRRRPVSETYQRWSPVAVSLNSIAAGRSRARRQLEQLEQADRRSARRRR